MMEIHGIHFRPFSALPRLSAGSRCRHLFAAIPWITENCPYPKVFLCWGVDGTCLRSQIPNGINEEKEDNVMMSAVQR